MTSRARRGIDDFLVGLFTDAAGKAEMANTLSAALTETERLMLAKRVFIVFLLVHGETPYAIAEELKVSPSTVQRLEAGLEAGQFNHLLSYLRDITPTPRTKRAKENTNSLLAFLEAFLASGHNTIRLRRLYAKYKDS